MYKVIFTQRALKDLDDLDKVMQNRIAEKLKECAKHLRYAWNVIRNARDRLSIRKPKV
ncbi:MAG: hypothetical protein BME93_05430 [Methanosarcinales archaeon Met12]|nr:MAG: hypothetical protein BME93_05430 [Methanosarcinales archaeon Met12]